MSLSLTCVIPFKKKSLGNTEHFILVEFFVLLSQIWLHVASEDYFAIKCT